jgi:hypothetical protein
MIATTAAVQISKKRRRLLLAPDTIVPPIREGAVAVQALLPSYPIQLLGDKLDAEKITPMTCSISI